MGTSATTDVFLPQRLAELIPAYLPGVLALMNTDLVQVRDDLKGKPGDKITIPNYGAVPPFADLTETTPMTPVKLTSTKNDAVAFESGLSVAMYDKALRQGVGAMSETEQEIARQLAVRFGQRMDIKLIAAAETTALEVDITGAATKTISVDAIIDAKTSFGDEQDDLTLILHQKPYGDLIKTDEFKKNATLAPDAQQRGVVAKIYGMPVRISRFITTVAGTPNSYRNLLVKKAALGLWFQKEMTVDYDYDVLSREHVWAATALSALTLFYRDPEGACKLITH